MVNPLKVPIFHSGRLPYQNNAHLLLPMTSNVLVFPFTHAFNSLRLNSGELFAGVKDCKWLAATLM